MINNHKYKTAVYIYIYIYISIIAKCNLINMKFVLPEPLSKYLMLPADVPLTG